MSDEQNPVVIQLDQFLKLKGVTQSGGEAKHLIQSGEVKVNGEVDTRRKKKLRAGDTVEVHEQKFVVDECGV
ncbi:MAG TPA: RNA-binding S4 domain-containing protein [Candidatus Melainabacteria bacterium]|jgi:ribosome-associated protein|nr:RNA-binding S4 domain-containing protein [Candidatus Melainabacteria bacterium]HIN66450.1 RNA-binding S4 domain-containing protein [Candidatus Obscuribacterales bacterium]